MLATATQNVVIREIERLSLKGFRRLKLQEPLEDSFEKATAAQRAARLWTQGLVAIALFAIFTVIDSLVRGNASWTPLLVRLGIVAPLALIVNASMRRAPTKTYREASITVVTCLIGLTHLYMENNKDATSSAYAQVGLIVAVILVNVVMRLQFPYAVCSSAVLLTGDLIFIRNDQFLLPSEKLFGITLAVCAIAMTVIANYSSGREERLGYLMRLRSEMQSEQLSFANAKLRHISSVDTLTGLANRHCYESQSAKLWREAVASGSSLAAIVIDIDCFKSVNDTRGHLYGDRVLVRVASLLLQGLRGKDDFAARFGGEEFVVLLPAANLEGALIVAERMRKLVEVAGSPALEEPGPCPPLSTVSCGVAACWPNEEQSQEDLLDAADKALYQAKRGGRNRVCVGELPSPARKLPSSQRWAACALAQNDSPEPAKAR